MGSTAWTKGRCWMIFSTFCRASASCLCGASPGSGSPVGDAPFCAVCLAVWVEDVVRHREHECAAPLLFSDEAVMQLVGFNAQQVRQGICQWGGHQAAGRAVSWANLPGDVGQQHREGELAGPGEPVQWGDLGPGQGRGLRQAGHRDCGWHRSGDHGPLSRVWAGHPEGAH
jgi:hypothetical protein